MITEKQHKKVTYMKKLNNGKVLGQQIQCKIQ